MDIDLPLAGIQPGFVALTFRADADEPFEIARWAEERCAGTQLMRGPGIVLATWGLDHSSITSGTPAVLGRVARRHDTDLQPDQVGGLMSRFESTDFRAMLPPFAALSVVGNDSVAVATDHMGFRQIYQAHGHGWAALSTSAAALAQVISAPLDRQGVAVQSLLGWQLGLRTLFDGVVKLAPSTTVVMRNGEQYVRTEPDPQPTYNLDIAAVVEQAAQLLRGYLPDFLDSRPDAVLQLTGGQDSRLLLSAIPRERRRGLKAMTLGIPGQADVDIAVDLAGRYGLVHQVRWFEGLEELSAEDAYGLCVRAAERLDGLADPIAFAALSWAEAGFDQGPRLCGLGGEVARGFYYLGSARTVPVTAARAHRLASWRMFANESAERGALEPDFAAWARELADAEVLAALAPRSEDWLSATDDLYLRHRMQRWAGVTDTAVCFDREVVNPMLDDRFLNLVASLPPRLKRESLFLSKLQVALDAELASIPLDGRPTPRVYAEPSVANAMRAAATTVQRFARKAKQRVRHAHRPPAGGDVLASKVVQFWRESPDSLLALHGSGVVRREWLDSVLNSRVEPEPSTIAFLLNLTSATAALRTPVTTG